MEKYTTYIPKFRGKSAELGWVYGCLSSLYPRTISWQDNPFSTVTHVAKVDAESVGQFIGLQDYAGTDIYEGDIIESEYTDKGKVRHVILYSTSEASFKAHLINQDLFLFPTTCSITKEWIDNFKKRVIGNFFDNADELWDFIRKEAAK